MIDFKNIVFPEDPKEKKFAVLVSCGAYNPIHQGHIEIITIASKFLEENHKFKVIGAFLSPSHDSYLRIKLKTKYISLEHRVEMCNLALKDYKWISTYEIHKFRKVSLNSPLIVKGIKLGFMNNQFKDIPESSKKNTKFFYVCGGDHFVTCSMLSILKNNDRVVVINRKETVWENVVKKWMKYKQKKRIYLCKECVQNISSSKIRKCIVNSNTFPEHMNKDVYKYMCKNGLRKIFC